MDENPSSETPRRTGGSLVPLLPKAFHQDVEAHSGDPTEVPTTVKRTKFPPTVMDFGICLKVNADADADTYVETHPNIVVNPPWIDSVANGGRPPTPCLLTRFGSIPLSPQKPGLDGGEFSSSCHNKLMATS
ncbi:hypothetical protein ACTXT7_002737 [Hymenolepis weldensis]